MASNDSPNPAPEQKSTEELDDAHKEIERLENADELPTELSDWPGGKAKFLTLGGSDAGDRYGEGATSELGPGDLVRHAGGAISIAGKMVDNPEDYKGEPIPGGPTDPDAPQEPGETKRGDDGA